MAEGNGDYGTVLGPDAHFKGEMQFEKGARLLGSFEGQVLTKGDFLVAEGASLQGEVDAGSIKLDGEVHGNLKASGKIQLSASAKLEGDLHTARLEVADGAIFIGHCVVGPNGKGAQKPDAKVAARPPVEAPKNKPAEAEPAAVAVKK
ncbi:MAG: polymer-forming cytoskeletal protein [bacterium]|nr:polymer-forming cytoskeletal protein [bacterium]